LKRREDPLERDILRKLAEKQCVDPEQLALLCERYGLKIHEKTYNTGDYCRLYCLIRACSSPTNEETMEEISDSLPTIEEVLDDLSDNPLTIEEVLKEISDIPIQYLFAPSLFTAIKYSTR